MDEKVKDVGIMAFTDINEIEKDREKHFYVYNCGYFRIHRKVTTLKEVVNTSGYLLIYLHKGTMQVLIDGKREFVGSGNALVYKERQVRDIIFDANEVNERYFVYFQGKGVPHYLDQLALSDKTVFHCGDLYKHLHYFTDIINDFKIHDFSHDIDRMTYLFALLKAVSAASTGKRQDPEEGNPELDSVIEAMRREYSQNRPLSYYAEIYHSSVSTFIRHFEAYTGVSPIKYLNNIKIEIGKSFLANTNLSITEISFNLGMDNPLYFCNFFKNIVGISPTKYREANKTD
ncbi:MAG: helix-turn-helix transcriptional regulator [Clostridia bacterium]|nr:helix-turn-helix transcriptional regulator [Clostridia bacterium]